jgi:predicted dehydrogenase
MILQFESGAIGYLGSNYVSPWANFCNLYGTEANVYFTVELPALVTTDPTRYGDNWNYGDRNSELYIRRKGEDQKTRVDLDPGEIITEEVEEFARCIRTGKAPEVGGQEGIRSLAVILAAGRSAKSGMPVKIADILSE